jgi:small subunit ribosomal protein S6
MHKYAQKRFRQYETIIILTPSINQGMADTITGRFRGLLDQYEGKLTRVSLWGLRRMAYRIKRHDKGIYYQINYVAPQGFVNEMEKYLRVSDNVIRYLTVQVSEIPVDPVSIITKSTDIEFGNVEEISEPAGADEEISEEAGEESQEIEEPEEPLEAAEAVDEEAKEVEAIAAKEVEAIAAKEVEAIAAKAEEAARQIEADDFADVEVEAEDEGGEESKGEESKDE